MQYSYQIVMKFEFSQQFLKMLNIKFHENSLSDSKVVPCGQAGRQADRHDKTKSLFTIFVNAPKNR